MVRGTTVTNSAKPVRRGETSKPIKVSKRVLLVAVLAVGLVTATPSQAQAPFKTHAQALKMLPPKAYAYEMVIDKWGIKKEYRCLAQLWGKESGWNPRAFNPIKVDGKNAGGIPQILGLSPKLHHTVQIDRGLKYIIHRYKTPCNAWSFWLAKDKRGVGWY
jgi:hypothetical protein